MTELRDARADALAADDRTVSGGYVGVRDGKLMPVTVHPDECLIRVGYTGGPWCCRADHPTEASDCHSHAHGIHHLSEAQR